MKQIKYQWPMGLTPNEYTAALLGWGLRNPLPEELTERIERTEMTRKREPSKARLFVMDIGQHSTAAARWPVWKRQPRRVIALASVMALCLAARGQQSSYSISEWTYVQGKNTEISGPKVALKFTFAVPVGGSTKHKHYYASFNFLTDVFDYVLIQPSDFYYSRVVDEGSLEVAWNPSPDVDSGLVDSYELLLYDAPGADKPKVALRVPLGGSFVLSGMMAGAPMYAALRSDSGVNLSPGSRPKTARIKLVTTANAQQGDINGDGMTDGMDFVEALFALNVGPHTGHLASADIDGDGNVSTLDLGVIETNMGWVR